MEVAVAAVDSNWLELHTVSAAHTRLVFVVGAVDSYCVVLSHTVSEAHCVSALLVPATITYCKAVHTA